VQIVRAKWGMFLANENDAYVGTSILRYGQFSEGEVELFRLVLRPGCVAVDAGANIGALTVPMARLVGPGGAVYAFEPQRMVFYSLAANLAMNDLRCVYAHHAALGPEPGTTTIPVMEYDKRGNFGMAAVGAEGEAVRVMTIDGLGLKRLDLLKIDVEGAELGVLLGAADTVRRCSPVVYAETDRKEQRRELFDWLFSEGYRLWMHCPPLFESENFFQSVVDYTGGASSINVIALHRAWRGSFPDGPEVTRDTVPE
jgi:FkbM family methyltransferase